MSEEDARTALREGYERTDFEMVQSGPSLEIPSSTPAAFTPDAEIGAETAEGLEDSLPDPYAFISPVFNRSDRDETQFQLHTKVYDSITNEFYALKVFSHLVLIFPKDEHFSFKTFRRAVTMLEDQLGVTLKLEDNDA